LCGAAGLGKTLLVEMLRRQLPEALGPVARLVFPLMPAEQLLAYLADELGGAPLPGTSGAIQQSVRRIADVLLETERRGRHALVVVDEAHLLSRGETFEALRLLLNFPADAPPAMTLVLCGQPGFLPMLDRMPTLEQRVGVKVLLRPLTAEETASYVDHRLRAAGARETLFDASALDTVHQLSCGVPRRINRLCDLALLIAFAEERKAITAAEIEGVASELAATAD
jgi:general secretion pathway protein A